MKTIKTVAWVIHRNRREAEEFCLCTSAAFVSWLIANICVHVPQKQFRIQIRYFLMYIFKTINLLSRQITSGFFHFTFSLSLLSLLKTLHPLSQFSYAMFPTSDREPHSTGKTFFVIVSVSVFKTQFSLWFWFVLSYINLSRGHIVRFSKRRSHHTNAEDCSAPMPRIACYCWC